jgi:hypothetical protein
MIYFLGGFSFRFFRPFDTLVDLVPKIRATKSVSFLVNWNKENPMKSRFKEDQIVKKSIGN